MAPRAIFDFFGRNRQHSADTSSSHSTFSVAIGTRKAPLSPSTSPKRRQTVSFAPTCRVLKTTHHSDYTKEERLNTWMTHEELIRIRDERRTVIRMMETVDKKIDNDSFYYRGLEAKTMEGCQRKRFNIADAALTVMEEQSHQENLEIHDPMAISRAYIATSSHCAEDARQRGANDERIAREII